MGFFFHVFQTSPMATDLIRLNENQTYQTLFYLQRICMFVMQWHAYIYFFYFAFYDRVSWCIYMVMQMNTYIFSVILGDCVIVLGEVKNTWSKGSFPSDAKCAKIENRAMLSHFWLFLGEGGVSIFPKNTLFLPPTPESITAQPKKYYI